MTKKMQERTLKVMGIWRARKKKKSCFDKWISG
jgi:hypothetical protein